MFGSAIALAMMLQAPTAAELLAEARAAMGKRDFSAAVELATRAIAAEPRSAPAYALRAAANEAIDRYDDGVRDWTKVIELDPAKADAHHQRGCLNFKAGRIDASLADFDAYLKRSPAARPSHWQRGISCYYAGQFEEGRKQFEIYQNFDDADVENAVWRFMCMTKSVGMDEARAKMLKIGDDRRVPMRDVYELYLGKKTPDDVLAAATRGDLQPATKSRQLFYAHLYLGIWFDLLGDGAKALDHLNRATDDHRIGHYMWDVARIHRDRLAKANMKN